MKGGESSVQKRRSTKKPLRGRKKAGVLGEGRGHSMHKKLAQVKWANERKNKVL